MTQLPRALHHVDSDDPAAKILRDIADYIEGISSLPADQKLARLTGVHNILDAGRDGIALAALYANRPANPVGQRIIAKHLGISQPTVYKHMERAREAETARTPRRRKGAA